MSVKRTWKGIWYKNYIEKYIVGIKKEGMEKFTTKRTSLHSEDVQEPIIIDETETTRRVFLATINDVKSATNETVGGYLVHQRKSPKGKWEDASRIRLSSLKAGEGIKLRLNSQQLRKLYEGLNKLYALSGEKLKDGESEYVVGLKDEISRVPKERKQYVDRLLDDNYGEEIWDTIVSKDPDLATRLSLARIQAERSQALLEFEKSLKEEKSEPYWQEFFKKNQWIFGYGLKYQFTDLITDQPSYGGTSFTGTGNQKGDYLLNTQANVKFTVLVEIKTPTTPLISKKKSGEEVKYRNGAYLQSSDLVGGVSQLQINCKTWLRKSVEPENQDKLNPDTYTINPRGILVIGNTKDLDNREKIESFESYRRNTLNPDIITFDELYERAKFIVENDIIEQSSDNLDNLMDDLPF